MPPVTQPTWIHDAKAPLSLVALMTLTVSETAQQPGKITSSAYGVMVDGKPAARVGEAPPTARSSRVRRASTLTASLQPASPAAAPNAAAKTISGSNGVFINGKPMARAGDSTSGCRSRTCRTCLCHPGCNGRRRCQPAGHRYRRWPHRAASPPPVAEAQNSRAPSERELTAKIQDAFNALRASNVMVVAANWLKNALREVTQSNYYSLRSRAISMPPVRSSGGAATRPRRSFCRSGQDPCRTRRRPRCGCILVRICALPRTQQSIRSRHPRGDRSSQAHARGIRPELQRKDIAGGDILATLLTNNGAVASGLNLSEETYLNARRALGGKGR